MKIYNRLSKLAIVSSLAFGLTACGMFDNTDPRYVPAELTEYSASASVATRWVANIGSGGSYGFAPQLVNNTVYAATPSGAVAAVDVASGALRWRSGDKPLSAGVGSDGNTTAVVTNNGLVVAYDGAGNKIWESQASSAVNIPPAVGSGVVIVRTTDYRVQAFDAATGDIRWEVQRPGPALSLRTNARMVIADNLVIVGMPNGRLMAVDIPNGTVVWEGLVAASRGASDLERISDVVGMPVSISSLLCGVNYQGGSACFNMSEGGRKIWGENISSATGMTNDNQNLYLPSQNDTVYAMDIVSGQVQWQQNALLNRRLTSPAVYGSVVALGDYEGYLHFLSRANGSLKARLQLSSDPITSPPVATEHGILVQTGNGNLVLVGVSG